MVNPTSFLPARIAPGLSFTRSSTPYLGKLHFWLRKWHGNMTSASLVVCLGLVVASDWIAGGGLAAGARRLSVVDLQFARADGLRTADWRGLASDLAAAEAGDATKLLEGADTVMGRTPGGHYDTTLLGLLAIACVEQPFGAVPTVDAFQAFAAAQRAAHPRAGAALLPWALCAGWPFKRADARLAINAAAAPKALVISGRFDPITGYAQGADLVNQLANGSSLLTYEGDGHAAALHSACVRDVVTQFLLDPTKPPTKLSCPAE